MSLEKVINRNLRQPAGVVVFIAILLTLAYSFWIASPFYRADSDAYFSLFGLAFLNLTAAALGLRVFFNKELQPRWQWGWLFIALGAVSNAIGELIWFYYSTVRGVEPFPSIADVFYLLYYPFLFIGVTIFPFERHRKQEWVIFSMDLLITLVFGAMVLWNFIIVFTASGLQGSWEGIFAFAYPMGDLFLLAAILAILQHDSEPNARWSLVHLAVSMAVMGLADFLFAFFENLEATYSISPLNALFMAAGMFLVLSAYRLHRASSEEPQPSAAFETTRRLLRLGLPYLAAVLGPILLFFVAESAGFVNLRLRILILGTVALICLVMFRQYLVLVENDRLYREMQHLATIDSLTGIYNRHFFNEVLAREIQRAQRYKKPFSVLLMDVDDFKGINDRLGHLRGDMVLHGIARELSASLRRSDFLARFGGDEFVVILPETDLVGAGTVKEKMRRAVAESKTLDIPVSLSVGAAAYRPSLTAERLLEEADLALYQFKRARTDQK